MANRAGWPRPRAIRSSRRHRRAPRQRARQAQPQPRPATANSDARAPRPAPAAPAAGQRADHHDHADQAQQRVQASRGGGQGAVHVVILGRGRVPWTSSACPATSPGSPGTGARPGPSRPYGRTATSRRAARAPASRSPRRGSPRASRTIRRPAPPARTRSTWPVTRRPPRTRAWSTASCALASASGMAASMGALAGTVTVTSTWMPRRRRAARRTAMATASPEYWPSSKATSTDSYSTSCSTIGSGDHDLRGLGQAQALVAPVARRSWSRPIASQIGARRSASSR